MWTMLKIVEETGGGGADGGIDLKLRRRRTTTLVQCKHWKTWKVGVISIREFYGVLMAGKADLGFLSPAVYSLRKLVALREESRWR